MKVHRFSKRISFSNDSSKKEWEMYHLRSLVNAGLEVLEKQAKRKKLKSCDSCIRLVKEINEAMGDP